MAKNNKKLLNLFLAFGLLFVLAGIVLLFILPAKEIEKYHIVLHSFLVVLFACFVYISLVLSKGGLFYISINGLIICLATLVFTARSFDATFTKLWPTLMILCGITLIPSGRISYHRFRTIYVIPSIMLVLLGAFFLLFSLGIIKMTVRAFFSYFMPGIFIASGIILLCIYFVRLKTKNNFPYIQDDEYSIHNEDFSEDEE